MPPDPDQIRQIQRDILFRLGVQNGEMTERQIQTVLDSAKRAGVAFGQASGKSRDFDRDMKTMSGTAKAAAGALAGLVAGTTKLSFVLGGGFLAIGARELDQYYKSLLSVSQQFTKYSDSIGKAEEATRRMGKQFGFTRDESLRLMSSIEQAFNFKPIDEMTNYLKLLENAVGANDQAMTGYSNKIAALAGHMGSLQQMSVGESGIISTENVEKMVRTATSLRMAGKMSAQDYKSMLDLVASSERARKGQADKAAGRSNPEWEAFEKANESLKSMQEFQRTVNEIAITMGEKLRPTLNAIAEIARSISPEFVKIMATVGLWTAGIATALGIVKSISSVMGGLGRLFGGGKGGRGIGGIGGLGGLGSGGMGIPVFVTNFGMGGFGGGAGSGPVGMGGPGAGGSRKAMWAGRILSGAAGGAAGYAAGFGVDAITGQFGMAGAAEGQASSFGSSAARVGGRIGAGAAAGGIPGAIGAGIMSIVSDGVESGKIAMEFDSLFHSNKDLQAAQSMASQKSIMQMGASGKSGLDIAIAKQMENVRRADESRVASKGGLHGWFGGERKAQEAFEKEQRKLQILAAMRGKSPSQNSEAEKAATDAIVAEQKLGEEIADNAAKQAQMNMHLSQMTIHLEAQEALTRSSNNLLQARLSMSQSAGGVGGSGQSMRDLENFRQSIIQENALLDTKVRLLEEISRTETIGVATPEEIAAARAEINKALSSGDISAISAAFMNMGDKPADAAAAQQAMQDIVAKKIQNSNTLLQAEKEVNNLYRDRTRLQEIEVQQAEANISLANNMAMGVSAGAGAIMTQVREITDVINSKRGEQAMAEEQMLAAQKDRLAAEARFAAGDASAKVDLESARAREMQHLMRYKEVGVEITQNVSRQAELTKTLRDGWISAIGAMNTGVGMFTKIKIDKETRLGTLMSNAPRPVVGVTTGFAGDGLRSATQYSAYGVGALANSDAGAAAFGAGSAEWARAMDKRTPLGFGANADSAAHGVSLWQELIGRNLSTQMAAAGSAPHGLSGIAGQLNESLAGGSVTGGSVSVGGSGARVDIALSDSQMSSLRNSLVKEFERAFKGVAEAAMAKVLDEINRGV